jgi:hypothetical protein
MHILIVGALLAAPRSHEHRFVPLASFCFTAASEAERVRGATHSAAQGARVV